MATHTATDVGRAREVNEDSVCHEAIDGAELLAVADGMGGHAAGDVASQTALDEFREAVRTAIENGRTSEPDVLSEASKRANEAVRSAAADETRGNMGATLVAALSAGERVTILNVGDSRAYDVSERRIEQITTDHSLVGELIKEGSISEVEARTHPQRHVLTQALGTAESVDPDLYSESIDGTLLLCSDGLTEEVPDTRIQRIVTSADSLVEAGETLITRANENGGSDNISVALYRET
jgi:protein phosphatase